MCSREARQKLKLDAAERRKEERTLINTHFGLSMFCINVVYELRNKPTKPTKYKTDNPLRALQAAFIPDYTLYVVTLMQPQTDGCLGDGGGQQCYSTVISNYAECIFTEAAHDFWICISLPRLVLDYLNRTS